MNAEELRAYNRQKKRESRAKAKMSRPVGQEVKTSVKVKPRDTQSHTPEWLEAQRRLHESF